jgi:hypothetical protein
MLRWLSIFLLVVRRGVLVLLQATLALFPFGGTLRLDSHVCMGW